MQISLAPSIKKATFNQLSAPPVGFLLNSMQGPMVSRIVFVCVCVLIVAVGNGVKSICSRVALEKKKKVISSTPPTGLVITHTHTNICKGGNVFGMFFLCVGRG